jgi:YD repeat-containing protein
MKTDPGAGVETRTYDAQNRLASVTDRTGAVTNIDYGDLGAPEMVERVGLGTYEFSYDDDGRLASLTLPESSTFDVHVDANGRTDGTTNPAGQSESTTLDGDDLVVAKTDHAGRTTEFERDVLGRVSSMTDPTGRTESYEYDAEDAIARVALGGLDVEMTHDGIGDLTQLVDPNGRTWRLDVQQPRGRDVGDRSVGRTTTFAYDVRDRVATATYPGGLGNVQITYDGVGDATRRLHSDGVDLGYTLDAQGC